MVCFRPLPSKEIESSETHIYSAIDEVPAYEVVMNRGVRGSDAQPSPVKTKEEIDLKECPAYIPVSTAEGNDN